MITRFTSSAPNSAFRAADFQSQFQQAFRKQSKRWASDATAAGTGATAGGATGTGAAASQSFAQRMWNGPVGVKTVHFWAPVMKVCAFMFVQWLADRVFIEHTGR